MANHVKYVVTIDAETGAFARVEQLGDAGELTEVPPSTLLGGPAARPPGAASSYVVNLFFGTPPPGSSDPVGGAVPAAPLGEQAPVGWSYQIHQPMPLTRGPESGGSGKRA